MYEYKSNKFFLRDAGKLSLVARLRGPKRWLIWRGEATNFPDLQLDFEREEGPDSLLCRSGEDWNVDCSGEFIHIGKLVHLGGAEKRDCVYDFWDCASDPGVEMGHGA